MGMVFVLGLPSKTFFLTLALQRASEGLSSSMLFLLFGFLQT
jgi:hypothetical protein